MQRLEKNTWVIVADGHRGILFRQAGRRGINLQYVQGFLPENLDDDGPAGARPPDETAKDIDEATFAKQLALKLNWHAKQGDFEQLAIIADPKTLGQMRPLFHDEVETYLIAQVAKTMTNATINDIEACLQAQ